MTLSLIESVIIHTFGRNSLNPQRTAWRRLLFAIGTAVALDVVITQSLATLRLPSDLFQSWLTIMLILLVQIVIGLIMLIVRASSYGVRDDQINDILGAMPVSEFSRWVVALIPGLIVIGLLVILSIGPLIVIVSTLEMHWYLFVLAINIGTLSGIGIGTYQPHASIGINFLLGAALVAAELLLFERIMTVYQIYQNPSLIGFALLLLLITTPFYWLIRSIQSWSESRQRNTAALLSFKLFRVTMKNWLTHKIIRHPKIIRSAVVLTGISGLLTYMWLQAGGGKDPNVSVIIICLSFIASLAASDIRGLTRPDAAPEILMVLGSPHFVAQQIIIGFFLGALVTSPIWLIIGITHPNHPVVSLAILGQLALGSTIALLANTFFVPSQQDVTAEFLSATISTCLIIALEKVTTSLKV
jgi:hypothetical protein